jgi:mono/diheme cytochrome c family protein
MHVRQRLFSLFLFAVWAVSAVANEGAELYHRIGCVACHDPISGYKPDWISDAIELPAITKPGVPISTATFKDAEALAAYLLDPASPTMPRMGLTANEAAALAGYLYPQFKQMPASAAATPTLDTKELNDRLLALNCVACHVRDGQGGPDPGRAIFFTTLSEQDLGDEGRLPPPLTGVGRKLKPGALQNIISGKGAARPHMATRMPSFEPDQVAWLSQAFIAADGGMKQQEDDLFFYGRNMYGRTLVGTEGKGCIVCHDLNGRPSLGIPGIDLGLTHERLQPAWFQAYLLDPQSLRPGTRMPPLFDPNAKQKGRKAATPYPEIAHIWNYLKEIDQSRLPDGMESKASYELIPQKRPMVFRTFMEGAGIHAIAVGFPEGIHAAFDADACRWALIWKGKFLDAESTWQDRFTPPTAPGGDSIKLLDISPPADAEFQGYELDKSGIPTFYYRANGVTYRDRLQPSKTGTFRRTLTRIRNGMTTTDEEISW